MGDLVEIEDVAVDPDGSLLATLRFHRGYARGDTSRYPVQRFSSDGDLLDKWALDPDEFGPFSGICVDKNSHIYLSEIFERRITVFSSQGQLINQFGQYGTGNGEMNDPDGMAVDANGTLWVADTGNHRVQDFTEKGAFLSVISASGVGPGMFANPRRVAVGPENLVYIADADNERVQIFDQNGRFVFEIDIEDYVTGITVDDAGYIYTTHPWSATVRKYSALGDYLHIWDTAGDVSLNYEISLGGALVAWFISMGLAVSLTIIERRGCFKVYRKAMHDKTVLFSRLLCLPEMSLLCEKMIMLCVFHPGNQGHQIK